MEALNIVRVGRGEKRQDKIREAGKKTHRLRMKHITWHKEGYAIRIALNGKIHNGWVAFRDYENEIECLEAARKERERLLKKLKKPLTLKNVQPGSVRFPQSFSSSNTGHRGLYYREYSYHKRGIKIFTKVIDVRWWNETLQQWGHTTVACKKHGGREKAIKAALKIQKKLEADHANDGRSREGG